MPLYKAFIKVFLRRLPSGIAYFIVFAVIAFAMGKNGGEETGFKASKLNVAVFDLDQTEESEALTAYIAGEHKLVSGIKCNDSAIQDALYYEIISYAVIIDEGYGEKLRAGEFDDIITTQRHENSYTATLLDGQLDQYFQLVGARMKAGDSAKDASINAIRLSDNHAKVELSDAKNKNAADFGFFAQYLAYIFICILVLSVAPCIMRLDAGDLRRRVICTPVSPAKRTLQLSLGMLTIVSGVWLIFMGMAAAVYGGGVFNRTGLLCMLNSLCYIIVAAGITLLVAQFGLNDNALSMVCNVVSLGMSFLCGVFVPQQYLGKGVLTVGHALPAYWYVRANNMLCGLGKEAFSQKTYILCLAVQLAMALAIFAAAGIVSAKRKR